MAEEKVAQPNIVQELLLCRSVYSVAFEGAMKILELAQGFPHRETDSIYTRIIKTSSTVCENLTKAWQNRDQVDVFTTSLNDAAVSASDTQNEVEAAEHAGLINAETSIKLKKKYEEVVEKIASMIKEHN